MAVKQPSGSRPITLSIRVLMLTMYDSELTLIRLLQAGVKGFMKKDIHPTELLHAIQAVMDNGYYYSAHTSSKLAGPFRESLNKMAPLQKIMLDEQEVKFLRLVCTEMTYKEIAREMGMNPRSIDGSGICFSTGWMPKAVSVLRCMPSGMGS